MVDTLLDALFEGYATRDIDIQTMFICILFAALISIYICIVYKLVNRNSFYDRDFHLSLFALAIITSAIILTIQSNIVVSLGMVGALSIVRFRTAVKSPVDLIFLFWSISIGIICGAGFAMIALISSIAVTIGIILFSVMPQSSDSMVLVVNAVKPDNTDVSIEDSIMHVVDSRCRRWKVRARNINSSGLSMAIEVRTGHPNKLVEMLSNTAGVTSVSLVDHDGDVTA